MDTKKYLENCYTRAKYLLNNEPALLSIHDIETLIWCYDDKSRETMANMIDQIFNLIKNKEEHHDQSNMY